MIEKTCKHCKASKQLGEFFSQPPDARANSVGTSAFCKQCHDEGKIEHGYGWYGDRYKSPDDVLPGWLVGQSCQDNSLRSYCNLLTAQLSFAAWN